MNSIFPYGLILDNLSSFTVSPHGSEPQFGLTTLAKKVNPTSVELREYSGFLSQAEVDMVGVPCIGLQSHSHSHLLDMSNKVAKTTQVYLSFMSNIGYSLNIN